MELIMILSISNNKIHSTVINNILQGHSLMKLMLPDQLVLGPNLDYLKLLGNYLSVELNKFVKCLFYDNIKHFMNLFKLCDNTKYTISITNIKLTKKIS